MMESVAVTANSTQLMTEAAETADVVSCSFWMNQYTRRMSVSPMLSFPPM